DFPQPPSSRARRPSDLLFGVVGLMALIMLAPVAVMVAVLVVAISADAAGSPAAAGGMILLFLLLLVLYIGYVLVFRTRFAFAPADRRSTRLNSSHVTIS